MKKYSSSITGTVLLITVTSILGRGIGFVREVIFADTFGLDREFEIYLVAAVLPILINTAIYYLAQNYFIPLYNKCSNPDERKDFLKYQFWLFTFIGLLLTVILLLIENIILNLYLGGSAESVYKTASGVYDIYVLSFPINAGYSILAAYLQAELKFKPPAISQLLLNLPIIIFVLFLHKTLLVLSIPIGYLAGSILQLFYLVIVVGPPLLSFNFRKSGWKLKAGVGSSLSVIILIEIINQLHPFIDRYFLDRVDPGGIASLNYASVIFGLPVTIFSFAMATVIFPLLSKYINSDTPEKSDQYFIKSLRIITGVFIPVTFIYFFDGELIISVIFQRGKFNINDTNMTYMVLKMYSLSLVFYAGYALINKMVFSSGLLKELLILSIMLMFIKIIINSFLVQQLQQTGLALGSAISFILLSVGSYFLVLRSMKNREKNTFLKDIVFFSIMAGMTYFISQELIQLFTLPKIFEKIVKIFLFIGLYAVSSNVLLKPSNKIIIG